MNQKPTETDILHRDSLHDWLWLCAVADECNNLYQSSGRLAAAQYAKSSIASDELKCALHSLHAVIRRRAVYMASLLPPEEAIGMLLSVLSHDECPVVRHEAAFCLGAFGGERIVADSLVQAMLSDSDPLVRHEAAEALGDAVVERAQHQLCIAKQDNCVAVQRTAVMALQELELSSIRKTHGKIPNLES